MSSQVDRSHQGEPFVTTLAGRQYRGQRSTEHVPDGCCVERYPGHGLIGSDRAWLGHTWAATVTWWAADNPTGVDGGAVANVDRLASRRAALRWLLDPASRP